VVLFAVKRWGRAATNGPTAIAESWNRDELSAAAATLTANSTTPGGSFRTSLRKDRGIGEEIEAGVFPR